MKKVAFLVLALPFLAFQDIAGSQRVTFEERHPLGTLEEQIKRFRWPLKEIEKRDPEKGDHPISKESFQLQLPKEFSKEKKYGLFVWISPGPFGNIPQEWAETLTKHHLIAVGANNSGNPRDIWYRIRLALDAVGRLARSPARSGCP